MTEKGNFDFLYNPIKEKMKEIISPITFSTYIENLEPIDLDGKFIVLQTPSESFAKYITGTLADKIRDSIIKADVGPTDFRLIVEGNQEYAYNAPRRWLLMHPARQTLYLSLLFHRRPVYRR